MDIEAVLDWNWAESQTVSRLKDDLEQCHQYAMQMRWRVEQAEKQIGRAVKEVASPFFDDLLRELFDDIHPEVLRHGSGIKQELMKSVRTDVSFDFVELDAASPKCRIDAVVVYQPFRVHRATMFRLSQ